MIATYRRIKHQRELDGVESGFTLIELLIVIVVLGILAAIVVFSLGTITGKSAVAACESDAQQLNTGLAAYFASNQDYPSALTGLQPNFLQSLPTNLTHYSFTYTPGAADTNTPIGTASYVLTVKGLTGASPIVSGTGSVGAVQACGTTATIT
jgi:prepilin-type N-terminal cleavage/methylation domain-containing protein